MPSAALDLSEPRIGAAYKAILRGDETDWLLLGYGDTTDVATLYASGSGGIDMLREHVQEGAIYFGFCREFFNGAVHYALITVTPSSLKGVKKARTAVHARSVGVLFNVPKASITLSRKDEMTMSTFRRAVLEQQPTTGKIQRAISSQIPIPLRLFGSRHIRRASSETDSRRILPSHIGAPHELLTLHESPTDSGPPPPPPKDDKFVSPPTSPIRLSYSAVLDQIVIAPSPEPIQPVTTPSPRVVRQSPSRSVAPRPRPDPAEQARRRAETVRRQEEEEALALEEERLRQEQHRVDKLKLEQRFEEEERLRKARLQAELRRAAYERARKEDEERRAEEERLQTLEEKKRVERARRLEDSRRIEGWRAEQEREQQERVRARHAARTSSEHERRSRLASIDLRGSEEGTVTVQMGESLVWRRRFYRVNRKKGEMELFKNQPDSQRFDAKPLDVIRIKHAKRLMEWTEEDREGENEQLQELEAISRSFAMEVQDAGVLQTCMFYTDTQTEKDVIMALISRVAGL